MALKTLPAAFAGPSPLARPPVSAEVALGKTSPSLIQWLVAEMPELTHGDRQKLGYAGRAVGTPATVSKHETFTPAALPPATEPLHVQIQVENAAPHDVVLLMRMARRLPDLLRGAKQAEFERRFEAFVASCPLPDPVADEHLELYAEERTARAAFLREVPCYTSTQIGRMAKLDNKNVAQTAYRWKHAKKIFGLDIDGGKESYPAFQFADGKPKPIVAELLAILAPSLGGWDIAHWCVAETGWLSGQRPIDLLDDPAQRERLRYAATQEVATNAN